MTVAEIAAVLNRLEPVTWDRCVPFRDEHGRLDEVTVYGWIARDDGRSDFVVLVFKDGWDTPWWTTSSAAFSPEAAVLLHGAGAEHTPCERVEDVFRGLVDRKIVLA